MRRVERALWLLSAALALFVSASGSDVSSWNCDSSGLAPELRHQLLRARYDVGNGASNQDAVRFTVHYHNERFGGQRSREAITLPASSAAFVHFVPSADCAALVWNVDAYTAEMNRTLALAREAGLLVVHAVALASANPFIDDYSYMASTLGASLPQVVTKPCRVPLPANMAALRALAAHSRAVPPLKCAVSFAEDHNCTARSHSTWQVLRQLVDPQRDFIIDSSDVLHSLCARRGVRLLIYGGVFAGGELLTSLHGGLLQMMQRSYDVLWQPAPATLSQSCPPTDAFLRTYEQHVTPTVHSLERAASRSDRTLAVLAAVSVESRETARASLYRLLAGLQSLLTVHERGGKIALVACVVQGAATAAADDELLRDLRDVLRTQLSVDGGTVREEAVVLLLSGAEAHVLLETGDDERLAWLSSRADEESTAEWLLMALRQCTACHFTVMVDAIGRDGSVWPRVAGLFARHEERVRAFVVVRSESHDDGVQLLSGAVGSRAATVQRASERALYVHEYDQGERLVDVRAYRSPPEREQGHFLWYLAHRLRLFNGLHALDERTSLAALADAHRRSATVRSMWQTDTAIGAATPEWPWCEMMHSSERDRAQCALEQAAERAAREAPSVAVVVAVGERLVQFVSITLPSLLASSADDANHRLNLDVVVAYSADVDEQLLQGAQRRAQKLLGGAVNRTFVSLQWLAVQNDRWNAAAVNEAMAGASGAWLQASRVAPAATADYVAYVPSARSEFHTERWCARLVSLADGIVERLGGAAVDVVVRALALDEPDERHIFLVRTGATSLSTVLQMAVRDRGSDSGDGMLDFVARDVTVVARLRATQPAEDLSRQWRYSEL